MQYMTCSATDLMYVEVAILCLYRSVFNDLKIERLFHDVYVFMSVII
jgi:hypothetical protein